MIQSDEFRKYATKHKGINSIAFDQYSGRISNMTRSVIEEREMPFREVDVFSRLMLERIIFIGTAIDEVVANIIQAQLLFLDSVEPSKDIQIYFNTPGGSLYGGFGIYDTMQFINPDIACTCTGLSASMGAVLLAAGTKGKRSALSHSRIMLHQPYGYTGGQASDIEIDVEHLKSMQKDLYEVIAFHTGQPFDKIKADVDRDYWMTPDLAKEYGIIDQVIGRNPNKK
ncbi:MAG: ATP-dependent Clp protease proteolytic subunit [Bacteroidales bacterium]|nr:ATP-dependent Clp protease proteolytic subunit [Bacteroidales bacterium]